MRAFKTVTLLVLGGLIFGSAAFFASEIFIKPYRLERSDRSAKAGAPTSTPTPDPGTADLARLEALLKSGNPAPAREGLIIWMEKHPQSPLLVEARRQLGMANMSLLFQPAPQSDGSTSVITYTVVRGDSLARIAAKHQSNAELIQRANNLPNINLQIGEQLLIPTLKISLDLDREAKTLTLMNNGTYLKEYSLLSAPRAPNKPTSVNSKVIDKVATAGTKRVAFGDKAYPQSVRAILLLQSLPIVSVPVSKSVQTSAETVASSISGPPTTAPLASGAIATNPIPTNTVSTPSVPQATSVMPGGYVTSEEDLREIFPLVSRNTPVVIH